MEKDNWQAAMALITKMLRVWHAARSIGENPLPYMHKRAAPIRPAPEFVSACESLFVMTEAVLGRPLVPARYCSPRLSRDEAAVLVMLRHATDAGSLRTSRIVPHGLPEALRWSVFAVCRALREIFDLAEAEAAPAEAPDSCPFDKAGLHIAA